MRFERWQLAALVVAAVLFWLGFWAGNHADSQRADEVAGRYDYAAICLAPDGDQQADLCQQWRSAEAASYVVWLTGLGLLTSGAGLIAILFTLRLNSAATLAAATAAEAAKLSAEAAIRVELPVLIAGLPTMMLLDRPVPTTGPYGGMGVARYLAEFSTFNYVSLTNRGRSPASLRSLRFGWVCGQELPAKPVFQVALHDLADEVVPPDGSPVNLELPRFTIQLGQHERRSVEVGYFAIWVFCELTYQDFMTDHRTVRFAWKALKESEGDYVHFRLDGSAPEEYRGEHR